MLLSFSGQLLAALPGVNAPEYGGALYTALTFLPKGAIDTYKVRADGHVDLSSYIGKDIDWTLEVQPKKDGKFKVTKITGGKAK